ncbi:MAG: hypothetical protein Q8P99_02920 [bacterium]|nr:hypothetical protein [bacterium]
MAFSFRQESNNNWTTIIVVSLVVGALAVGTYLLFFAKTPLIEVVSPPEVEDVSELSQVNFSTTDFSNDPVFTSLRRHVSEAEAGPAGRENPFAPF